MTERTTFPPDELTEDEHAATVGRYDPDIVPHPDPPGPGGRAGRNAPPPEGTVYVRDEEKDRAASIRTAVAQFEAVEAEVPEHLQALFDALPAELQEEIIEEVEEEAEAEVEEAQEEVEEAEEEAVEEEVEDNLEEWTVAELKAALDELEIEYPATARKADLIELVRQAEEG